MKQLDPRLIELFKIYDENPKDSLWDCHGTWVAYHAAIERMAAKAGVQFDKPEMIVNNPDKGTVVVCVSAHIADKSEWSFGEVSPANNKNGYPYAMAEKRAKDRVALKLLGMSGLVYSEEEADDFKATKPGPEVPTPKSSAALKRANSWKELQDELSQDMVDVRSPVAFAALKEDYRKKAREQGWPAAWMNSLKDEFAFHERELAGQSVLEAGE